MASSSSPRRRENLRRLASDLLRRSWLSVGADHYLDDYRRSQWLAPPLLADLQRAALRRLLWHCVLNVPRQAKRIGAAVNVSEIEHVVELTRLPIATNEERLRDPDSFVALAASDGEQGLFNRSVTQGSAQPDRNARDALAHRTAVRLRAEEWAGAPPGRVVAAWGRDTLSQPRPLTGAELSALGTALRGARGAVLSAPGDSLASLLVLVAGERRARLRAVLARGADPRSDGARLASRLGIPLHRLHAHGAIGVIAATCLRGGLHVQSDHLILEIVDDHGAPVPIGTVGALVVTDLHDYAAPWLRHALDERGRLLDSPCPCGRGLPLLELESWR